MGLAAVTLPFAAVAGLSAPAWAAGVNATGSVTCTGVSGSAKFSPPLKNGGSTSGTEKITVKFALSSCTPSGSNVSGTGTGSAKGTITTNSGNSCAGLLGVRNVAASLPVKWKGFTPKANPSTLSLTQVDAEAAGHNGNPAFAWGSQAQSTTAPATVTGSFPTTTGHGEVDASISAATLAADCGSTKGLKSLGFDAGSITG